MAISVSCRADGARRRLALADALHDWQVKPCGTSGYAKAEVTLGGVDTDELSSKTMEAKRVPGLYFIGEVVDVTGWLGGYNFQWAWASAAVQACRTVAPPFFCPRSRTASAAGAERWALATGCSRAPSSKGRA